MIKRTYSVQILICSNLVITLIHFFITGLTGFHFQDFQLVLVQVTATMSSPTSDVEQRIEALIEYTLKKWGTEPDGGWHNLYDDEPRIVLAKNPDHAILAIEQPSEENRTHTMHFWLPGDRISDIVQQYPSIDRIQLDEDISEDELGLIKVPLNGSVDDAVVQSLIDETHALAVASLDDFDRLILDLATSDLSASIILNTLIEAYELESQKAVINEVRRPVLLLTSTAVDESLVIGSSKMGGAPDLLTADSWPKFSDGSPLPFILQINLSEVADLGFELEGLPKTGLLSFFSLWGKDITSEGTYPDVPEQDLDTQPGWSVILHQPLDNLERIMPPEDAFVLQQSVLDLTTSISLPWHPEDFEGTPLTEWHEDDVVTYYTLIEDFEQTMKYKYFSSTYQQCHTLGGYAKFPAYYPVELTDQSKKVFLTLESDQSSEVIWADDGKLTVYVDNQALKEGRFEQIWGEIQCDNELTEDEQDQE